MDAIFGCVRWTLGAAIAAALSVCAAQTAHAHGDEELLAIDAADDGPLPRDGSASYSGGGCDDPSALGVSRVHRLDPTGGPRFGRVGGVELTPFLRPGEVVLTFDDGPNPRGTPAVLAALEAECVQATFFVVGQMARWHSDLLRAVADAGHTIAGHTFTHPMPVFSRGQDAAYREILEGFDEIERQLGRPAAAMFRFPGLAENGATLAWLSQRGIVSLGVDILSGDTRSGQSPHQVVARVMAQLRRHGRGVVLMHDPLIRTARALPMLLDALQAEGFRVVHLEVDGPGFQSAPPAEDPSGQILAAGFAPSHGGFPLGALYPEPSFSRIDDPLIDAVY